MAKKSKYNAVKTIVDGITFASKAEARRYGELQMLLKSGEIKNLELQPKYSIFINGKRCFDYKADFKYLHGKHVVVEDVKGVRTAIYKLKRRCVESAYGFIIHEI